MIIRFLASFMAVLILGSGGSASALEDGQIDYGGLLRIGGVDRYETAALLARDGWPSGSSSAIVVTGLNWADAVAVAAPAAAYEIPVLLVDRDYVPSVTLETLRGLGVRELYLIGGPAAISPAVERQLSSIVPMIRRLAGESRYETAVRIAEGFPRLPFFPFVDVPIVSVVRGDQFTDALQAGGLGGRTLLTPPGGLLPESALGYLRAFRPSWVVGVGDPGPLAQSRLQVESFLWWRQSPEPDAFVRSANGVSDTAPRAPVVLVSGENWPDALAARPWSGRDGAYMFLTRSNCIPPALWRRLDILDPPYIILVGGPNTLSAEVAALRRC